MPKHNIPVKILVDNCDISSPFITKLLKRFNILLDFPSLKLADVTPVHKKDERTNKTNYRPLSILP